MGTSNFKILAYEDTPLGILCLRRRKLLSVPGTVVTEVTLNHEFLMSSYNTASERALASQALEMVKDRCIKGERHSDPEPFGFAQDRLREGEESHKKRSFVAIAPQDDTLFSEKKCSPDKEKVNKGRDLQVLVGGLGLGYTAAEVLASDRVGHVEVVEFLPQVIDWLAQGLIPLADSLNGDSRLLVSQGDVYKRLTEPPQKQYDVILIDVDHSPDDHLDGANDSFYKEEGLESTRKHLAKDGVLGVWSYAESSPFADALRNVFGEVLIKPVTFTNVLINNKSFTDWLFFVRA